ncbi:hypothetical protein RJK40_004720 [Salmonella enterica]|nr:hypothetical protein [Salmonella enterica subsp. enterica]ELC5005103.1 hypothetical protein [Salmonella enterica]
MDSYESHKPGAKEQIIKMAFNCGSVCDTARTLNG